MIFTKKMTTPKKRENLKNKNQKKNTIVYIFSFKWESFKIPKKMSFFVLNYIFLYTIWIYMPLKTEENI